MFGVRIPDIQYFLTDRIVAKVSPNLEKGLQTLLARLFLYYIELRIAYLV